MKIKSIRRIAMIITGIRLPDKFFNLLCYQGEKMHVCIVIFGFVMIITGLLGIVSGKTIVLMNKAGKQSKDIEGSGTRWMGALCLNGGIAIVSIGFAVLKKSEHFRNVWHCLAGTGRGFPAYFRRRFLSVVPHL
jgi:hypothetical protein